MTITNPHIILMALAFLLAGLGVGIYYSVLAYQKWEEIKNKNEN